MLARNAFGHKAAENGAPARVEGTCSGVVEFHSEPGGEVADPAGLLLRGASFER